VPTNKSAKTSQTAAATVDHILENALGRGASDVHLDPGESSVAVRLRIDGWLQAATKLPRRRYDGVVRELKRRAKLDPKVVKTAQQGSAGLTSAQGNAHLRVATMPTTGGEKIVVSIQRELGEPASLATLGYWGDSLRRLEQTIAEPHGLVLSASPDVTAASLSSLGMVHLLNNPSLDVITLEELPSSRIPGISQTEVKPAHGSFDDYLKAALQQDPNMVMLSRLNEPGVIATALEAALSGRLLLGGVHSSSAVKAVAQLRQAYREPFMLAAALRAAVALRFVRKLCPDCRESYQPDAAEQARVKHLLRVCGVHSTNLLHELEQRAVRSGLGDHGGASGTPLSSSAQRVHNLWRASAEGCPSCRFSGYRGRTGVMEVMTISDDLRQKIAAGDLTQSLYHQALGEGMVPLPLDGFIKVLRGLTSFRQVYPLLAASGL
jgi:type II secretory ATPase GspE/PulE/Tfp pilus assembly ATPase PilB-like protein